MSKPPFQNIYVFEGFKFDAAHLMLYRGDEEITLAPKAARTLLTLIERRGEILGKDELMKTIWNDSVVEESNLTQYVHVLRKILGTSSNGKPLIETLRRRGYRFNGEVSCLNTEFSNFASANISENGNSENFIQEFVPHNSSAKTKQSRILTKIIMLAAVAGLLIFAVSAFWYSGKSESATAKNIMPLTLKRLTPDQNAIQPTVSPDGKYLVYSLLEKDSTKALWLKDLTNESAVQIMPSGVYLDLAFSSDGTHIYYVTNFGDANGTLVRIPLFGGKPQIIVKNIISPPAISPDGKRVAIIKGDTGLNVLDESGGTNFLLEAAALRFNPLMWNSQMSWSPDGKRLALCGKSDDGKPQILDFSVNERNGQFLPVPDFSAIDDVLWLADASGLLITAKEKAGEPFQIWHVSYPSGKAVRLTKDFNDYNWLSLSADSKTLVVGRNITKTNVWLAPFDNIQSAKKLTFGGEAQDGFWGLAFAPNDQIIFTSPRSGNLDLWKMNYDGSVQEPLTANQGSLNHSPRITPDGRYIVFASSRGSDNPHIWRMDADGQNPIQLTNGAIGGERFFDVSADSQRIIFAAANEQKLMATRQVSINGGESFAIADNYQSSGSIAVSPDGKLLMRYVYLRESGQLWRFGIFPIEGGEPQKLLEISAYRNLVRWAADGKSLLYIKSLTSELWQQPIDGSLPKMVFDLKDGWLFNFAVSPDFKQIVYAHGSQFNEAVLIENFGVQ